MPQEFDTDKEFDTDIETVNPAKQDGIVYRIPCRCCKVYIWETGRPMQETMKEHTCNRDIQLARTQTFAIFEHAHKTGHYPIWTEVKFIDRDHHYSHKISS